MVSKFRISKKYELVMLKYWMNDFYNNFTKIPENLKGKITEQQGTDLFAFFQDLGDNNESKVKKEIVKRINELEEKSFFYILSKNLKELFAQKIAKFILILLLIIILIILKIVIL